MTLNITRCPTCGSDQIKKVCRDWTGIAKGQTYVAPALTFYECPACGERVFEREALLRIQAASPAFAQQPRQPTKAHTAPMASQRPNATTA
jgi:YgiT-type zinc finger domain-containing protein